jgi:hypothetical protein
MIRSVEMERLTVTSAKPFDEVVTGIKEAIHPNMAEFWQSTQRAACFRTRCLDSARSGQDWSDAIR